LLHDEVWRGALGNPLALAFAAEALLLVPVLAWLLARQRLTGLSWGWFVALALLGGLAFALPVALLWRPAGAPRAERRRATAAARAGSAPPTEVAGGQGSTG